MQTVGFPPDFRNVCGAERETGTEEKTQQHDEEEEEG